MIEYEKVNHPADESGKECFYCLYKYPLSNFTNDQSGFLCNQCSDFWRKFAFSPGTTAILEVNGEKYRAWYVDIGFGEARKLILDGAI